MAAFCTSCGSPLSEGQTFCTKCGARAASPASPANPSPSAPTQGAPATPPAAAPPTSSPAAAASTAPAPAATGGGGAFIKILLIVVAVIFVFGAIGVGAVVYIGYRVKQKAREMGLTSEHMHHRRADALGQPVDACKWLSKEDVSAAIGMTVVRAESTTGSDAGCAYSVMGDVNELTMKHAMQLNKAQAKEMSKQEQEKMEQIGKSILGSTPHESGDSEHPGEVVVMALGVDENAAQFQMKLNRGMLSGLGPMATQNVPDLGDEAFAAAGSMLFVRKGESLLRMTYTQCPCGTDEMIPLARKVAGAL